MAKLVLRIGELSLDDLRAAVAARHPVELDPSCWPAVKAAHDHVLRIARDDDLVYGVNTGFGSLAKTRIEADDVRELQRRLLRSHAVGIGPLLDDDVVRLILILKINSLARGHSGVQRGVIEGLLALLNAGVYPCVPSQGSVGASGDLAPLAHLSLSLIGEGDVRIDGIVHPARIGLDRAGVAPIDLGPKEGLALINGTQVSTALALKGLFDGRAAFAGALVAGAMSGRCRAR